MAEQKQSTNKTKQKVGSPQEKQSLQQQETKKLTATQRIEALERTLLSHHEKFEILAEEIDRLSNQIVSLNRRLNATIEAAETGSLTKDSVSQIVVDENVKDLQNKVDLLKERGVLQRNDDATVTDYQFVVGRELDDEGNVANPRVQFAVNSLQQSFKDQILGAKKGDTLKPEGSELTLEITEVYDVIQPQQSSEEQQQTEGQQAEGQQQATAAKKTNNSKSKQTKGSTKKKGTTKKQ